MEPTIAVRDLWMRYGDNDVLTGVDFHIDAGGVVCLLGPNGAGKTTTIEILEGFRIRSAGEVSVLGQDPARADEDWRARTGVVLQSWRDHPRWTPRRLLDLLGGYYAPYSTPERNVRTTSTFCSRPSDSPISLTARSPPCPAGSAGDSMSPWGSSAGPSSCSWTSPRPGSTRRRAETSTSWCAGSPRSRDDDPADHSRPRRGREAGRPGADPRRRSHRRRRHRGRAGSPGGGRRVSWSKTGSGSRRRSPSRRLRPELFAEHGEAIEISRSAGPPRGRLPGAGPAARSGHGEAAAQLFTEATRREGTGKTRTRSGGARRAGPSSCRASAAPRTRASPVHGGARPRLPLPAAGHRGRGHRRGSRGGAAEHSRRSDRLRGGDRTGVQPGDGEGGRHPAAAQGRSSRAPRVLLPDSCSSSRSACCRRCLSSWCRLPPVRRRDGRAWAGRPWLGAGARPGRHVPIGMIIGALVPSTPKSAPGGCCR